ncbi:MAG: DUF3822 family protein [Bacteroidaceae bacterium]|nr:DUF3822 family protein [Bacteroidaceae bacterium]
MPATTGTTMLATGSNSLTGYRLSIRFGADGFSFSVSSTLDGSVVQSDRFPVPEASASDDVLRQALRKPYLMDYRFQSVELVADTQTTIVPLEHFSKGDMLAFYRLCFPGQQVSVADMQYQILSSLEAVMIFRLEQTLLRIVQECYPDVRVCCTDAQQLEHFASLQERRLVPADAEQRDAYVSFGGKRFFIAVFLRNKLQYAGSQAADNDSDRTFLLLGIWKALDMHAQRDVCHLEDASSDLQKTLGEYILNIE